jgi:epoxide hydrolase-like predicted phosphatase
METERPAIKAVIFDVGGVLIHVTDESGMRNWEARLDLTAGQLAHEVFTSPVSWRAMIGLATAADVWMEVACLYRLNASQVRELAHDVFVGEAVDEQMVAFVRTLRPRYKTALLTNAWPEARQSLQERRGLGDVSDMLILSCEERLVKPDTRIYALAAERLGVTPRETLFVDDYPPNLEGARDAGMQALQFITRQQVIAEMSLLLERAP